MYKKHKFKYIPSYILFLLITLTACSQGYKSSNLSIFEEIDRSDWVEKIPDETTISNNETPNNVPKYWDDYKINKNFKEIPEIPIPMEQAIVIGFNKASNYYNDLKLVRITSWDKEEEINDNMGENGSRVYWNMDFANKDASTIGSNNGSQSVSISMKSGVVWQLIASENLSNNGIIDFDKIRITAKQAVEKAKEYGLIGGKSETDPDGWINGFLFQMSVGSLTANPDEKKPMLDVIGVSKKSHNFSRITFDIETGEIILAEEKFNYDENGRSMWRKLEK